MGRGPGQGRWRLRERHLRFGRLGQFDHGHPVGRCQFGVLALAPAIP